LAPRVFWRSRQEGHIHPHKIRDRAAFHYEKLNLEQAIADLSHEEGRLYLSMHPANTLYYAGSTLVFSTVSALMADRAIDTKSMTHIGRMSIGVKITMDDLSVVNLKLHSVGERSNRPRATFAPTHNDSPPSHSATLRQAASRICLGSFLVGNWVAAGQ
jgi:hypothetical protein